MFLALKGIIAALCGAYFVCDEKNYVFVSYFTYGLMHFLQTSAHSKSNIQYLTEVSIPLTFL